MMNLPLLFWAHGQTGHTFYRDVAVCHADTALANFVRPDFSVRHAYGFSLETGAPEGEENFCGYGVGSHWARGAAWAVYGFLLAYRYTGDARYFEAFEKISGLFIKLCEADGVPIWDFRLPKDAPATRCHSPSGAAPWDETAPANTRYNRDTSAAAIALCAFLEAEKIRPDAARKAFAEKTLASLCETYFDPDLNKDGILKSQNGNMTYTPFGDYFFVEALARRLYGAETAW
jgi:unsaturated chondroitin disaccharide hydrolase